MRVAAAASAADARSGRRYTVPTSISPVAHAVDAIDGEDVAAQPPARQLDEVARQALRYE